MCVCVCVTVSVAGELETAGEAAEHASLWRFGQQSTLHCGVFFFCAVESDGRQQPGGL